MVKIGGANFTTLKALDDQIQNKDTEATLVKGKSIKIYIGSTGKLEKRDNIIKAAIVLAKKDDSMTFEKRKETLDNILNRLNAMKPLVDGGLPSAVAKRQKWGKMLYKREEKVEKAKASLDKMEQKLLKELENTVKQQAIKGFKDAKKRNVTMDDAYYGAARKELESQGEDQFTELKKASRNAAIKKGASDAWDKVFKSGIRKGPATNPIWPEEKKGPTQSQILRDNEKAWLAAEKKAEEERLAAEEAEKVRLAAEEAEKARLAAEKKAEEERLAAEKLPCGKTRAEVEKIEAAFNELKRVAVEMGSPKAADYSFDVSDKDKADKTYQHMTAFRGFYRNKIRLEKNKTIKEELKTKYRDLDTSWKDMRNLVDNFPRS